MACIVVAWYFRPLGIHLWPVQLLARGYSYGLSNYGLLPVTGDIVMACILNGSLLPAAGDIAMACIGMAGYYRLLEI